MADGDAFRLVVAHLFQRAGRTTQTETELANAASLDLKWWSPKEARGLVAGLVRAGYLARDDEGELAPTFDARAVQVPLTFRPPSDLPARVPPPGAASEPSQADRPNGVPMDLAAGSAPSQDAAMRHFDASRPGHPSSDESRTRSPDSTSGGTPDSTPPSTPDATSVSTSGGTPGAAADDPPAEGLPAMLAALAAATDEDTGVWVERMETVVQRTGDRLRPEAALLLAAAGAGIDVTPFLADARAAVS